jgi:hypothetical protein
MSHTTATPEAMILLPLGGSCCLADPTTAQTFTINTVQILYAFLTCKNLHKLNTAMEIIATFLMNELTSLGMVLH